jgi:hypothetical protein
VGASGWFRPASSTTAEQRNRSGQTGLLANAGVLAQRHGPAPAGDRELRSYPAAYARAFRPSRRAVSRIADRVRLFWRLRHRPVHDEGPEAGVLADARIQPDNGSVKRSEIRAHPATRIGPDGEACGAPTASGPENQFGVTMQSPPAALRRPHKALASSRLASGPTRTR